MVLHNGFNIVVVECMDSVDPDCIECGLAINSFESVYGLDLSEQEINAILESSVLCNPENEFFEHAKEILEELHDVGFLTCKSSFDNYTTTGSGATINFVCNKIQTVIYNQDVPIDFVYECYDNPDVCIATGSFELDENGNVVSDGQGNPIEIGMNTRKELTAQAYDAMRLAIHQKNLNRYLNGLDLLTQLEINNLFLFHLEDELKKRMTGVALSSGTCVGSIGSGRLKLDIFGVCILQACNC